MRPEKPGYAAHGESGRTWAVISGRPPLGRVTIRFSDSPFTMLLRDLGGMNERVSY